ncbi:hypothetical protein [Pseudoalteromonas obscura]|uniref:Uncharacterized protein n=1 Tax=Pseudoalteromonas obscura TaxID=3048491 RepID=A0ABT7EUK9_9GAMM|nr:hypothetical protein [Pseudoalteromonas sp. P94(2023)]MDK2598733.1 hypothetical protein [Pseudoalteromonas sp. P94(2023)]
MRKDNYTARSADILFAQGQTSRFTQCDTALNLAVTLNSFQGLECKRLATANAVSTALLRKVNIVRKVYDTARSADILFAQGEVSTLLLRKVNIVQNVTTVSEASTFNLRKVK